MSNRTDRDEVLNQIVQRQQEKDRERAEAAAVREAARSRGNRWPTYAMWVGVPALLMLTGWNLSTLTRQPPPAFSPTEESEAARFDLYVTASDIEAFRQERGYLPTSLAEVG